MNEVIWVLSNKLESFKKQVSKLVKKAYVLECDIPKVTITDETKVTTTSFSSGFMPTQMIVEYTKVIIEGQAPTLDEWSVIARINHKKTTNGYENIIDSVSRNEADIKALNHIETYKQKPHCDHCDTSRFRKSTFLLKHIETDEVVQVGSTCVEDFVRSSSLANVMHYFTSLMVLRGSEGHSKSTEIEHAYKGVALKPLIKLILLTIKEKGFLNKSDAQDAMEHPTSALIYGFLNEEELDDIKMDFVNADTMESCDADEIYQYLTTEMATQPANQFTLNVMNAIKSDFVNVSNRYSVALTTGAIGGYLKRKEKAKAKEKEQARFTHEHFGLVGQRSTYTLTLISSQQEPTEYGDKNIYFFTDNKNRKFKWTCWGNKPELEFVVGETYTIKGTISKHENFNIPTTVINRCRDIKKAA